MSLSANDLPTNGRHSKPLHSPPEAFPFYHRDRPKTAFWIPRHAGTVYPADMAYIEGHARAQALLLPASVEDYVAADNPVRFIDAFVDDLDLGGAGFVRA